MTFKPFVGDEFRATFSIFNKAEQIRLFLNPPALSFPLVLTTKRVPRVRVCVCVPISCTPKRVCGCRVWRSGWILLSHRPQFRNAAMGGVGAGQDPAALLAGRGRGTVPDPMPPITSLSPGARQLCTSVLLPPPSGIIFHPFPPQKDAPVLPQAWPHVVWGPRPSTSSHGQAGNWEHWFPRGKTPSPFAGAMVTCSDREADGCNESICTFSTSGVSLSHCTYI